MDISRWLQQTVSWQPVAVINTRDDASYNVAVTLPCRKRLRTKDLIAHTGEVTTALMQVLLPSNATVAITDLLDGREVVALENMVDYLGNVVGFWAYTR